jgi:zinc transport system ATP-binding protein
MTNMSRPAVEIRSLSFSFETEQVLTDIDLTVPRGEFLAVIGPNGGGKTTLLRLMLGVFSPGAGDIRIWGKTPGRARQNVGYVPQFPTLHQDFPASVLELVLMGAARPSFGGGSWSAGKASRETAERHLVTLGLESVMHRHVGDLSGGQLQRALVARALMGRPKMAESPFLLLLDEPTASIDPQGKFCFYNFLNELRDDVTIVVVSHDLMLASPFFTSVVFVNRILTRLQGGSVTPEQLTSLYGSHQHPCPVADLQHASGLLHSSGCTHPSCAPMPLRDLRGTARHVAPSLQPEPIARCDPESAYQSEPH